MIFDEGIPKKYLTLRDKKPSIYYLEDFYFKILQVNVDSQYNIKLKDSLIGEYNDIITVNFPEFLDVSRNLQFIKKVFFGIDLSINTPGEITLESESADLNLVAINTSINEYLKVPQNRYNYKNFKSFPDDMLTLYLGYRYTAVKDIRGNLNAADSLCCAQLIEMDDTCFNWLPIARDALGIEEYTNKPTVCKFKVELNLPVFRAWLQDSFGEESIISLIQGMRGSSVDFNFILHPPYMDRMSFKTNIKIVYPLKTTRLKVIDKVTFRANKSYTINNKLYSISFIDKETNQRLFKFDSVLNEDLFTNLENSVDTSKTNSTFGSDIISFEDGVLIDFNVPNQVQLALSRHNNYKISIVAKDLTTQNRG